MKLIWIITAIVLAAIAFNKIMQQKEAGKNY
jgi:L-lactate permease